MSNKENVWIRNHKTGAGHWIYKGYKSAFEFLGHSVYEYDNLRDIPDTEKNHFIMAIDHDLGRDSVLPFKKAKHVFLYVQPNKFPGHWNSHPNFISQAPDELIEFVNEQDNISLWCFSNPKKEFYHKWKHVNLVPLAFDDINYEYAYGKKYEFDICYVGGWANNGFNEKQKIILETLSPFKNTEIKCGFFINKNLSHEQECQILSSSKISLNIHDLYQRELGLDVNERTFKGLGLTGVVLMDKIKFMDDFKSSKDPIPLSKFFHFYDNPEHLLEKTRELLQNNFDFNDLWKKESSENKKFTKLNHTYKSRAKSLLQLARQKNGICN